MEKREGFRKGQLNTRLAAPVLPNQFTEGLHPLQLGQEKECFLYVPRGCQPRKEVALVLLLHGAGGNAAHGLSYLQTHADESSLLLLAPSSHAYSWDFIASDAFNRDVLFIDQALSYIAERFALNPSRLAIGGFSDGASYALSLGLSNGHLFTHIIAFSPGFYYTYENKGKPAIFISHGLADRVLPIGACSRRIVPRLQQGGYDLFYHEFQGAHAVPAAVSRLAVHWYLQKQPATG